MSTLDEVRNSHRRRNRTLVQRLERIRAELSLGKSEWAGYLRLTEEEYERVLTERKPVSAISLLHLSERLSIDPEALETGKINYGALVQAQKGNLHYIAPEYKVAATSRKFTVINTLDFVEKYRGRHYRIAANRHFQVYENFWSDWQDPSSEPINIRFLGDLWAFLRKRGLSDEDFRSIGFQTIHTHRKTHIGRTFSSFRHPREVYECLFSDFMGNFEKNHIYRITKLTDEVCIAECKPNPEVAEALKRHRIGSLECCQVKIGLVRSLPLFVGRSAAAVHETHCVHRGDAMCRFFCDFSEVQPTTGFGRRLSLIS